MKLQKHESESVAAMIEVAQDHGLAAEQGRARNTRHPINVCITHGAQHVTISIPSSPKDRTWCVRLARKIATKVCRNLLSGAEQPPHMHI